MSKTGPEEMARQIFGRRAGFYVSSEAHSNEEALAALVALAAPAQEWEVLDVATGTGHMAMAFAPHVTSVIGLDITPEMLSEARALASSRGLTNVQFVTGDAQHIAFEDSSFDLVTCRRAAHHFADIVAALKEMNRVLRSGGLLLIEDRSVPEDDLVDEYMNRLDVLHDASHIREYRESEWRQMVADAGFVMRYLDHRAVNRPLTALTAGVEESEAQQIRYIVESLGSDVERAMGVRVVDGQVYTDHWFVCLLAAKP